MGERIDGTFNRAYRNLLNDEPNEAEAFEFRRQVVGLSQAIGGYALLMGGVELLSKDVLVSEISVPAIAIGGSLLVVGLARNLKGLHSLVMSQANEVSHNLN